MPGFFFRTKVSDTPAYIRRLHESNPLREPLLRKMIQTLELPTGSDGLDAGCGIGLQTPLLLEAIAAGGHVIGLDILPELLAYGAQIIQGLGLAEQITFRQGDINQLPFDDDRFDWAWSADCIGYPAGELQPILKELMRVTKSGGRVILLGWSSQQVLSGYPLLEARLNAACSSYIPFLKDKNPETHFMRALTSFRQAGLQEIKARTFVGEVQSPLTSEQRVALSSLFEMLWDTSQPPIPVEDCAEYKRLCNSSSTDFILDLPDYYAFFTYSLFQGKVRKN
jgi:ubiquinone/menaquinone biosynthesis C-methylase UbiE